jgi:hypothetical protein
MFQSSDRPVILRAVSALLVIVAAWIVGRQYAAGMEAGQLPAALFAVCGSVFAAVMAHAPVPARRRANGDR